MRSEIDLQTEHPTKMTVCRNVKKYRETGTSHNRNKGISGRPTSAERRGFPPTGGNVW